MASRKRQPSETADQDTAVADVVAYPAIDDPLSDVLATYGMPANTLWVRVVRSHDGLYKDEVVAVPNDDRTAGLINGGFVEVVPPPISGVLS